MKIIMPILVFLSSVSLLSCSKHNDSINVSGKIRDFEGQTVYAKKIDPFRYHSNSILDSSKVDSDGSFKFNIKEQLPILLTFSKYGVQYPLNLILRERPEHYYYGFCAMFYIPEPTVYLTEYSGIDIDWTVKSRLDSFAIKNVNADNQNTFYNYYLNEDLSDGLYDENRDLKYMEIEEAWNITEQIINSALIKYNVETFSETDGFHNYIHTEIRLGAINEFLKWCDAVHSDELISAYTTNETPIIYSHAIETYAKNNWNHQSVEFYKMTERFITHSLNKSNLYFQSYYPPSDKKFAMAKKVLLPELAERYIENFKEL